MPAYQWLITQQLDTTTTASKIKAMQTLGVPYEIGFERTRPRLQDARGRRVLHPTPFWRIYSDIRLPPETSYFGCRTARHLRYFR